MFFVLSKTLNYLTMPLVIITIVLIIAACIKSVKWKKRLSLSGLFLLLFWSNDFITNEIIKTWEVKVTPYAGMKKKYEWGILLTGVTKYDVGPEDRIYFSRGADRVTHTLQLYRKGIIAKILISGGSGRLLEKGRKEADEIKEVLMMMGVPEQDMMVENQSRNTHESAVAIKDMLKGTPSSACLLISSAFHLRRSSACFSKVGMPMDLFAVDFLSHDRKFYPGNLFIPKIESLGIWQTLIKEWVGMIAYKMAGYI